MRFETLLIAGVFIGFTAHAEASILVEPTTTDGTLPGTSITYTVSDAGGGARAIWVPGSTNSGTWNWTNDFPEFETAGGQTLTVTFSAPVELNQFVLGVNSISNDSGVLTVSGGTATTTDFDLTDGLSAVGGAGVAGYDPATGTFSVTGADQSVMLGSDSTNTISSFALVANGGGDGFTLFFGPTVPAVLPEPASMALLAVAGGCVAALRRRRSVTPG